MANLLLWTLNKATRSKNESGLAIAAYAAAHNETHGTDINTGVILMAVQPKLLADGTYDKPQYLEFVIEGDEFAYWSDEWMKRVELYYLAR